MGKIIMTLEIETRNQPEDAIKKSDEEIKNAIRVYDDDVVDGFTLTTDFKDCDNLNDFFLSSAKIIDITIPVQEIERTNDMEQNPKIENNRMLELMDKISTLTDGIYQVGPYVGGFGISASRTDIHINIGIDPYPFYGSEIPQGTFIETFTVKVEGYTDGRPMSKSEVTALITSNDLDKMKIGLAIKELSKEPLVVPNKEFYEAYHEINERERQKVMAENEQTFEQSM